MLLVTTAGAAVSIGGGGACGGFGGGGGGGAGGRGGGAGIGFGGGGGLGAEPKHILIFHVLFNPIHYRALPCSEHNLFNAISGIRVEWWEGVV